MDWSQLWGSPLEAFGVITGVICVFLITVTIKWRIGLGGDRSVTVDHVWNWPIGLFTSAAYVVVFWQYKLYLNSLLQLLFYIPTGLIGWGWWLWGGENKTRLPIRRANWKVAGVSLASSAVLTGIMFGLVTHFTSSAAPFWDALVAALSIVAQFVMGRKYVEHWWLWLAVDTVGVGLFWSQGLYLTAVLYTIYWCICVRGLFTWNRMERAQTPVRTDRMIPIGHLSDDPWGGWDA